MYHKFLIANSRKFDHSWIVQPENISQKARADLFHQLRNIKIGEVNEFTFISMETEYIIVASSEYVVGSNGELLRDYVGRKLRFSYGFVQPIQEHTLDVAAELLKIRNSFGPILKDFTDVGQYSHPDNYESSSIAQFELSQDELPNPALWPTAESVLASDSSSGNSVDMKSSDGRNISSYIMIAIFIISAVYVYLTDSHKNQQIATLQNDIKNIDYLVERLSIEFSDLKIKFQTLEETNKLQRNSDMNQEPTLK